jgi:uncharacterized membrane protein
LGWAISYLLDKRPYRDKTESVALWALGGLALGVTNPTNAWDFPAYLALGLIAVTVGHVLRDGNINRTMLFSLGWRLVLLLGLAVGLYQPFEQWFAPAYSDFKRNTDTFAPLSAYLYIYGLFLFILITFLIRETRRWLAETPATVVTTAGDWLPWVGLGAAALVITLAALWYLQIVIALIALPLMLWAALLLLRAPTDMPPAKQAVLFLIGTAFTITVFVELFSIGGDRMNTIFKFYIQAWLMLSVAAGAALAWLWAEMPSWGPRWSGGWLAGLAVLVFVAALYTVTAASAKIRDRFPSQVATPNSGCQPLPNIPMPTVYANNQSLPIEQQPHSLDSMAFMDWSAYCDSTYFVPLAYDADAIRWMQMNVDGSPTIVEANVTEYRWGNRFTIYTGLPGVVGWNYHTRQHRGIVSSEMVTKRVDEIQYFYCTPLTGVVDFAALPEPCQKPIDYATINEAWVKNFLQKYAVRYVIVGVYERAVYPPAGIAKFDMLQQSGVLTPVYQNPGTVIYQVNAPLAGQ